MRDGSGDVLEAVLAEIGERRAVDERAVACESEHLAAVAGAAIRAARWTSTPT